MKAYIISIIITSAVIQLGGLFITDKSYKKLYQLTGGMILILTLLRIPQNTSFDLYDIPFENQYSLQSTENKIAEDFTSRTEDMIKKDVENEFLTECEVDVETSQTYDSVNITVNGAFEGEKASQIKKYILQKYCTNNDEVRVVCDN